MKKYKAIDYTIYNQDDVKICTCVSFEQTEVVLNALNNTLGQRFDFVLTDEGDHSVGIPSVREEVSVTFRYGGWDKQDTEEFLKEALQEVMDMKCMTAEEDFNQTEAENRYYEQMARDEEEWQKRMSEETGE